MEVFRADNFDTVLKLAIVGLVAGVMFYALNKYVLIPAEAAVTSALPSTTTTSTSAAA